MHKNLDMVVQILININVGDTANTATLMDSSKEYE